MAKSLADMTNEERWRLFPIILKEHDPQWKARYLDEKKLLNDRVGAENIERISHIGSTSVTGLAAKPTIDILVEIKENTDLVRLITNIKAAGYLFSRQDDNPPPHMMFMKGYTPEGFRGQAFHVHVRYSGDWNELYFRDYLKKHPETAEEYGRLKLSLKEVYEFDRDAYTAAKSDFIIKVTDHARIEFKNRYKPVSIRICQKEDVDLLACMNEQLIEDENFDIRPSPEQLRARMLEFIETDYKAYVFEDKGEVKGYALVNHVSKLLYLRHFFICRECRREGYGVAAFHKLMDMLEADRIDLEVMYWNERGYRFWQSLGFRERSIYMRYESCTE